jgi:ADP-ribose pyrophosphatase YjhB (NUDIX family)
VRIERRYPAAPLVGVAAVVFDGAGRVLLVQRGREPRKGSWGLPGGLIDVGEALLDAVRREVREETGLEIAVRELLTAFEPIYRDAEGRVEYHYVVLDYWATVEAGEAAPGDDAAAVAWAATDADALSPFALAEPTARVVAMAAAARHAALTTEDTETGAPLG